MTEARFWLSEGSIVGGRYRLERVLGVGGYGITYRGMDVRLGRLVAVKEYYPSFCASRFADRTNEIRCNDGMMEAYNKGITRFLDEAKTLVQLSNVPGVVRVNDFFQENNTAYLVMDFLDGKNLKQMADGFGGRIPAEILIPVISPVISALKQVHAKGMIHRDISPDNIMMLEDGSVRLIDFGNARDTTDNKSMTLAMKQGFAAPEQYRSKGQGTWTDVYGICATMYYCLTGKLPPQAMERLTGAPFPLPSEMGVEIPPQQEKAIMDGLELYVQRRIQNMDELWKRMYESGETGEEAQPQENLPRPKTEYSQAIPVKQTTAQRSQTYIPIAGKPIDHKEEAEKPAAINPSGDKLLLVGMKKIRDICSDIFRKIQKL